MSTVRTQPAQPYRVPQSTPLSTSSPPRPQSALRERLRIDNVCSFDFRAASAPSNGSIERDITPACFHLRGTARENSQVLVAWLSPLEVERGRQVLVGDRTVVLTHLDDLRLGVVITCMLHAHIHMHMHISH